MRRATLVQYAQLLVGCAVLGVGVALMLEAALGSDGYSTLVNGLAIASGLVFWQLNIVVGAVFVGLAWLRGTRPGPGTLVQWFFVGFVISGVMAAIPEVTSLPLRIAMLAVALVLIAVGVAAYLASATGAGPAEAMALAWDPPVPFRWSYNLVQLGGALARVAARRGGRTRHRRGLRAAGSGRRPRPSHLPGAGAGARARPVGRAVDRAKGPLADLRSGRKVALDPGGLSAGHETAQDPRRNRRAGRRRRRARVRRRGGGTSPVRRAPHACGHGGFPPR